MDSFTVSSFLHLGARVLIVGGLAALVLALGERAVGLNVKRLVNAIEKRAQEGEVWPGTSLLLVSILALAYILG